MTVHRSLGVKAFAVVVLMVMLASMFAGCSLLPSEEAPLPPPLSTPKPMQVTTKPVTRNTISNYVTAEFECKSTTEFQAKMPIDGTFKQFYVEQRQFVSSRAKLYELDLGDLDLELMQMEIDLRSSEKAYSQAKASGNKDATDQAYVKWQTILREYNEKKAIYDQREATTPISGTVHYVSDARPGDYIQAGTLLVRIIDLTSLQLVFDDVTVEGDAARQFLTNDEVEIIVGQDQDGKDIVVTGTVIQAPNAFDNVFDSNPTIEKNKKRVIVEFDPKFSTKFIYGARFKVRKLVSQRVNTLTVPKAAINNYQGRTYVYVLDENGLRVERDVVIGANDGAIVEILDGLSEGEEVVTSR
nr:HlyD family efflux transporter periplasmic adaptor subunit [bacterium]